MTEAPYRNPSLPVEERLADLLSRMTLEEKVAQMSIFHPMTNILVEGDIELNEETSVNLAHGIGGLGRPGQHASARETAIATNAFQKYLRAQTCLGIPAFFVDEALHGLMAHGSTSFPQAIGLASTWEGTALTRDVASASWRVSIGRWGNWCRCCTPRAAGLRARILTVRAGRAGTRMLTKPPTRSRISA